jgi:transposase
LRFAISGGWRAGVVAWLRAVPDVPGLPSAEELAALPHEELAVRLAGAYLVIARLTARVDALERRAGKDSSTSSKPPSSDSPFKKKPRDRSLREKGKRAPGKQPGEPGTTMRLVDDPEHRFWYPPAECRDCGAGLAGEPVFAQRRHQVTDVLPAPAPEVTEHVAQSKACPCCGTVTEGELPAGVRARASFGPETHAQAALLTSGNYIPAGRAADLMAAMAGVRVSVGWIAGVRAKAAALVGSSGFMDLVSDLLRQAEAVHADEDAAVAGQDAARTARAEGKKALDPDVTDGLTSRYRTIAESGLAASVYRRTTTAADARRIARRFLNHEDMILRFITRPDLDIFTNNEAERTIRPVKVQQRSSGGCWRTLQGLADFAVVQSYLSTATKWGIPKIDALRGLFNGQPWMPPGLEPATG